MTGRTEPTPSPEQGGATERTDPTPPEEQGLDYRDIRLTQLEAENVAQADRIEHLLRRIRQLDAMMSNMSRVAQAARVARLGIRRPQTFVRLPVDLARAVLHPVPPAAPPPQAGATPEELARRAAEGRQLRAAIRTVERRGAEVRARDLSSLRVAFVGDDSLRLGFAPECDLVSLDAVGWRAQLESQPPDLLLVTSAWRGLRGSWAYRVAWYPHPDAYRLQHLRELTAWCAERGIPTVFWSTEDPLHTERFAEAAALFDHLFTVHPGSIDRLAAQPGRSAPRVGYLAHAVQPRRFHPGAGADVASPPTVFIGAAYRGAPLLQRDALDRLLDAGARAGLVIHDRALGADPSLFGFAERHRVCIGPWLPTAGIADAIRAHRVLLGAPNPDVVPARLLEALACGRPVVTSAGAAAAQAWPGAVLSGDAPEDLDAAIARALDPDPALRAAIARATTEVLLTATFRHRLATIATEVGYAVEAATPRVAVVALVDDLATASLAADAVSALGPLVAEVVLGTADDAVGAARAGLASGAGVPVSVVRQSEGPAAERYRQLAGVVDATWVHVLDPRNPAPVAALRASLAALAFTDASVVGEPGPAGQPWTPGQPIHPGRALVRLDALARAGWTLDDAHAGDLLDDWSRQGAGVLAAAAGDPA